MLVEDRLFDGLILQPLPAPAMQNVDIGKVEAKVLRHQRLDQMVPQNEGEAVHQDFGIAVLIGEFAKLLQIERQFAALGIEMKTVGCLAGKRL